jgi:N-acylneuraminate cytidylyltransferase
VTSDNADILAVSEQAGAIPILRPEELASDTATSESAILHALECIQRDVSIDLLVFLQCTSPLRKANDIDNAISKLISEKSDSLLSVTKVQDHFIWHTEENVPTPSNFDYRNRRRRQDITSSYLENGSIYVFKPDILLRENNRLGGKISIYEMDKPYSFQIDDENDVIICSALVEKLNG